MLSVIMCVMSIYTCFLSMFAFDGVLDRRLLLLYYIVFYIDFLLLHIENQTVSTNKKQC